VPLWWFLTSRVVWSCRADVADATIGQRVSVRSSDGTTVTGMAVGVDAEGRLLVDLAAGQRLDVADHPELKQGVRLLAGEARARYVHTVPGAEAEVLAAWAEILGDRMWVWSREEAIATGAFGPTVTLAARERIGDVVAAARDAVGVVERDVDPAQARLVGHHGSFTEAEQLVPLLVHRS